MKGCYVRSRAQWINEGEKPSSYFLGLESNNFTSKIILKIENDKGELITDQKEILHEANFFYQNLFNEGEIVPNADLDSYFKDTGVAKLKDSESTKLEGIIYYNEASATLKQMKNGKSPGSSGFVLEFYMCFWNKLGHYVVRSINYGFWTGDLSITQKVGIITCIPKGDKPRHFKKNWRPLSLLNTVYKIASGSIASRIKTILKKLINVDQTGFISERFIHLVKIHD